MYTRHYKVATDLRLQFSSMSGVDGQCYDSTLDQLCVCCECCSGLANVVYVGGAMLPDPLALLVKSV